ncbi:amino acid permease [Spirillospora sp. NPDC029432]|uniref:APC family permease n=1 Tax=Spirillospora sp. NPDC029432 TaxID=3154599 RepID=UPI0034561833
MTWDIRMRNTMFRKLPVEQATGQLYGGRHRLRVVYRTRDLVVLGLGVMIGAGIFKISGVQAAANAGPAVIISFLIAGAVCLLAALAYAELSSIVPVAGSAYSFSYVAFGEVWAWVVGWSLILELLLAASVVARAWSLYAAQALADLNVPVPEWLAGVIGQPKGFDVFALGILLLLVVLLATGSRLGLRTLWFMVMAKLIVIGLVIAVGLTYFDPGNLTPFVPPAEPAPDAGGQSVLNAVLGSVTGGTPQVFGVWGILAAAPAIAFAYIGFDLIATASEETDDAPRKVPRGMITSLVVAVVLYLGVAITLVGMVSYGRLDPEKVVLTTPFTMVGAGPVGHVVNIGAVIALTTVILVVLISLTRVVFSMSRDGLLPRGIAGMSRYRVPSRATLVAGGAAVVMSQTIDVLTLEQMVVIGTLFAFLFVCAAVLALRRDRPDLHRPFRMPAAPLTAVLGILATGWLMLNLKVQTWGYFTVWMLAGLVLYLVYGRRRSEMRRLLDEGPRRPPAALMTAPPPDLAGLAGPPPGARPVSTVPPPPGAGTPGVRPYQPERFDTGQFAQRHPGPGNAARPPQPPQRPQRPQRPQPQQPPPQRAERPPQYGGRPQPPRHRR